MKKEQQTIDFDLKEKKNNIFCQVKKSKKTNRVVTRPASRFESSTFESTDKQDYEEEEGKKEERCRPNQTSRDFREKQQKRADFL